VTQLYPIANLSDLQEFKTKVDTYRTIVSSYGLPSDKKSTNGLFDLILPPVSANYLDKSLSSEQIRARYAKKYTDEAWGEVISYVALMKELGIREVLSS
jgi:hypothetical protein